MDTINYLILGLLQGIFEWIPISSEGVVALAAKYLGMAQNPVDLALFLHGGTLLAALWYYRRDWENVLRLKDRPLIRFLIITTAISLPIGFFASRAAAQAAMGAGLLLLTGAGLLFTAWFQAKKINLNLGQNKLAAIAGVLQGLAALPGFSRSGSTIFGLSLGNLPPAQVLRLSYLMSVPAVAASTAYLALFEAEQFTLAVWPALAAGFVVGILTLDLLTKFAEKINFAKFALAFSLLCFAGAAVEFGVAVF
jgi:undecaprenyl-diphosphatase